MFVRLGGGDCNSSYSCVRRCLTHRRSKLSPAVPPQDHPRIDDRVCLVFLLADGERHEAPGKPSVWTFVSREMMGQDDWSNIYKFTYE